MASLVRFLSRSVVARSAGVASIAQRTAATAVPPEVPFRPEEYTPEELEICEYCPIPVPYSAKEHFYMIKKFRAARAYVSDPPPIRSKSSRHKTDCFPRSLSRALTCAVPDSSPTSLSRP